MVIEMHERRRRTAAPGHMRRERRDEDRLRVPGDAENAQARIRFGRFRSRQK